MIRFPLPVLPILSTESRESFPVCHERAKGCREWPGGTGSVQRDTPNLAGHTDSYWHSPGSRAKGHDNLQAVSFLSVISVIDGEKSFCKKTPWKNPAFMGVAASTMTYSKSLRFLLPKSPIGDGSGPPATIILPSMTAASL